MAGSVAITGATGFLGRHVCEALTEGGFTVRALARSAAKARGLDAEIVEGTLEEPGALERLCAGSEVVIHCAGVISACDRAGYDRVNVAGTQRLGAAATASGVKRFVLVSSLAAREPELSDYGASKRAGEVALRGTAQGLGWCIVRPPAVYGPGDRGTLPLIRQLTRRVAVIPGTERARFSLIHVHDLARALVDAAAHAGGDGQVYEIHDQAVGGYSWRELAAAAGKVNGRRVRCAFVPRAVAETIGLAGLGLARLTGGVPQATPGKIRELYHEDWVCRGNLYGEDRGWAPQIGFEDGFAATVAWYRSHGWL